jgi:hypothetical protein
VGGLGAVARLAPAASAQVCAGAGATIFTADVDGEDVSLGVMLGGAGLKTTTFFGVEGEFAIGWLPIPLDGDLFGRVGYADLSIQAGGLGAVSEDGSGLVYGDGIALSQIPFTKLRPEDTRYAPDAGEIDAFGISALFQFQATNAQRDLRQHGPPARRAVPVSRTAQTRGPHTTVYRNRRSPRATRSMRGGPTRPGQA